MCGRGAYVRDRAHTNVALIGQRFDLGKNLAPHWVAVVAHEDQFERSGPLFWQQTDDRWALTHEASKRLKFVEFAERPLRTALDPPFVGARMLLVDRLLSKVLPYAFTEHGAIQAANVLASSQAVERGIVGKRGLKALLPEAERMSSIA